MQRKEKLPAYGMILGREAFHEFSEAIGPIIMFRNNPPMKFRSMESSSHGLHLE
jgi:hypothetical protein